MQDNIVSLQNDIIAIICKRNNNGNNTYNLLPIEVSLGKIMKNGFFRSENYYVPSIEETRYIDDETVEYTYVFADSIENIKTKYENIDNISLLMYNYLKDIASNLNIALKSDDGIHIYSVSYDNISPEIGGDKLKRYVAKKEKKEETKPEIILPSSNEPQIDSIGLEKYLKERIFENDDIIEDIVTTIAMNYRATNKIDVEAILSVGPTGSGKTATFKAISEYLGIPLTIYDCNLLTSAGYVGKDIDDVMKEVYLNCDRNIKRAEKSILVFDEIDKIAMRGMDVKDAAVQYSLLKLLDGYKYTFETAKNGPKATIDTSFMTIAGLGAFPEIFRKKEKEGNMGFKITSESHYSNITTDDLIEFGMLAELMGRLSNVFTYKELDKEALKRILLDSKNSPLLRKKNRYLQEFNTEILYDDAFIDAFVEEAYKKKAGGRGLSKLTAYIFKKADRELNRELEQGNLHSTRKLVLTQNTISDNRSFKL